MKISVKICGLSDTASIDAVIKAGADMAGFIFFEKSPRHIDFDTARLFSSHIGERIKKVAVSVDADDDLLDTIVAALKPDFLQFHGSESAERVSQIRQNHNLPIIKSISISGKDDLLKVEAYEGIADYFLFDAKPPAGSELPGGNAVGFNWKLLSDFDSATPWFLAGGLNADNVTEAILASGTSAIDVSSGVEDAPGVKSIAKIGALVKTVRTL